MTRDDEWDVERGAEEGGEGGWMDWAQRLEPTVGVGKVVGEVAGRVRSIAGGDGWWADNEERGSYPTDPTLPRSLA